MQAWGHRDTEDIIHYTDWNNASTRRRFISKVCSIIAMQLALTLIIVAIVIFVEDVPYWLREYWYLYYVAAGVCLIIMFILYCFDKVARRIPFNYILLFIFTFCESIVCSYISIQYRTDMVLQALGVTVAVCIGLALFALFAPWDFTGCGPFFLVLSIILLIMGLLFIFIRTKILIWIIACFGLILFSMYLVYDIQLMVGGKRKNQYSEEDYIIAALGIYVDIVHIFMYILTIFGLSE